MRLTLPLLIGSAGAAVVTWTDASTAMSAMEDIVKRQSAELQAQYVSAKEAGSSTQTCGKNMCDTSSSGGTVKSQFLNRGSAVSASNTCSRLDLDVNGDIVTSNVGGRHVASRPTTYDTTSDTAVRCKYANELCPADLYPAYNGVRVSTGQVARPSGFGSSIRCVDNEESRSDYLTRTGCVSAARRGMCHVKQSAYGFSRPDSAASLSLVGKFETCASEQLLQHGPAGHTIREVAAEFPQTAWHFSGFQQTGLYRTWPAIYQCRTEHQCSGCSDPRFRGWYAGAASGPKDVVIIIDTSGSMRTSGRMAAAIEAAQWTVNTLSATDYATVVAFASTARVF